MSLGLITAGYETETYRQTSFVEWQLKTSCVFIFILTMQDDELMGQDDFPIAHLAPYGGACRMTTFASV
jgi:hypothetical protein